MKILSIKDSVRSDTSDEGWGIHTDGSLRYRGRVMVPQSTDMKRRSSRSSIAPVLLCIQVVRKCTMIFIASISGVG